MASYRLCRQRHVTESHPARRLQHTTRSHYQLYQSINGNHNVDITFDARRQHVTVLLQSECVQQVTSGYTWFYKWLIKTIFEIKNSYYF